MSYQKNDLVEYAGSEYLASEDVEGVEPPAVPWQLFISAGVDGERGTQGETGPQGPSGAPPNTLTVGTVNTLGPGEYATVEIIGDSPSQTINFGIPQGNDGAVGLPLAGGPGSTALMQVTNGTYTAAPDSAVSGSKLAYAGLLSDGTVMVASNLVSGTWAV
jgi:hypothetical protein